MLIDATHSEETRVVVVNGNKLDELDFEIASKKQLKGNIYLAKVTRVEPSLQAAFVEYGGNRHGFLAFSEIHPDYYRIPVADREALLAQERDLEEREDTIGSDIEMGDPRPGRGQRRSFRGEPRGDDSGNPSFPNDQVSRRNLNCRPNLPPTRRALKSPAPGSSHLTTARRPESPLSGTLAPPAAQPDSGDVPLDWFAPEEPASDEPARKTRLRKMASAAAGFSRTANRSRVRMPAATISRRLTSRPACHAMSGASPTNPRMAIPDRRKHRLFPRSLRILRLRILRMSRPSIARPKSSRRSPSCRDLPLMK